MLVFYLIWRVVVVLLLIPNCSCVAILSMLRLVKQCYLRVTLCSQVSGCLRYPILRLVKRTPMTPNCNLVFLIRCLVVVVLLLILNCSCVANLSVLFLVKQCYLRVALRS